MKIPSFALPHRVDIVPFIGSGAYGPVYDEPNIKRGVRCRIELKRRKAQNTDGQDVLTSGLGIFPPGSEIKIGDKVIWSKFGLEYTVSDWAPVEAWGDHSIEVVLS